MEGVEKGIVEHLRISCTSRGTFQLQGQVRQYRTHTHHLISSCPLFMHQTDEHGEVVSAVNSYVTGRKPPLAPALGKSFETQLSISDDPPSYSQVDRTLAPDLTPLPSVTTVKIESVKEGIYTIILTISISHTHTYQPRRVN